MTVLFVDHHDSFVNNLISWFKKNYSGDVVVAKCDELNKIKLRSISAVVFSPGPGHPSEYKSSLDFYKNLPPTIPFLGVCLGYQIMLYAHGAQLMQIAATPVHGQQVKIGKKVSSHLLPPDVLQGYFVLYNSLGIELNDSVFQKDFVLLASKGKFSLAAEHVLFPRVGVQFHPESFASIGGDYFMRSFLRLIQC